MSGGALVAVDEFEEDIDRHTPVGIWQVVVSGSVLLSVAILIVAFFSQTFDYGDDVIDWLLVDSWKPSERPELAGAAATPPPHQHRRSR